MLLHFHLAWVATATVCSNHICSSHKLCLIMQHLSKDWPTPELQFVQDNNNSNNNNNNNNLLMWVLGQLYSPKAGRDLKRVFTVGCLCECVCVCVCVWLRRGRKGVHCVHYEILQLNLCLLSFLLLFFCSLLQLRT